MGMGLLYPGYGEVFRTRYTLTFVKRGNVETSKTLIGPGKLKLNELLSLKFEYCVTSV